MGIGRILSLTYRLSASSVITVISSTLVLSNGNLSKIIQNIGELYKDVCPSEVLHVALLGNINRPIGQVNKSINLPMLDNLSLKLFECFFSVKAL